VLAASPTAPV